MKRYIILLFLLPLLLSAKNLRSMSGDYEVEFGIFGKIGKAHCELVIDKGTYKITVDVEGSGLAKFLSQDRHEIYESTGLIKDGILVPDLFVKERRWGSKMINKKYFIDHKNQTVRVLRTNKKGDISKTTLPYFSDNDILTLFFNLDRVVTDNNSFKEGVKLKAIGANRENGEIDIIYPSKKEINEITKLIGNGDNLLKVILNQKIFSSKNGQFLINIDNRGVCDKFILKDVLFYGDLKGKLKNLEIKE